MPPALGVDIDAQHAPEFNEWYNKEHLPELLSVPGILSAVRPLWIIDTLARHWTAWSQLLTL